MQISSTRCSRCELRITAAPAAARRTIVAFIRRMPTGSSPVSGSSSSSACGVCSSPHAMASFCFMPRESSPGSAVRLSGRSSSPSRPGIRPSTSADLVEPADEAEVLLHRQVLEQMGLVGDEGEQATSRRPERWPGRARRSGSVPRVGMMMPAMLRIVVVFPAPFGPTRPRTSPGLTREAEPLDCREVAVALLQPLDLDHSRPRRGRGCRKARPGETFDGR